MTITEILKAKGVSDEIIAAVVEDMKTNKIFTASEENLDIRYGKLKTQHEGLTKQHAEATALIEELKKSNQGNEGLQQKVKDYETQVQQLQQALEQTRIDAEIKVSLLAEKALDVDYLAFKLKAKGEEITLDDQGKIKGWDDKLAGLKTQFPAQFEGASGGKDGFQVYEPNKLKSGSNDKRTPSKEEFKAMGYEERLALKRENEELFHKLSI